MDLYTSKIGGLQTGHLYDKGMVPHSFSALGLTQPKINFDPKIIRLLNSKGMP
jgi:hypothetical protein